MRMLYEVDERVGAMIAGTVRYSQRLIVENPHEARWVTLG